MTVPQRLLNRFFESYYRLHPVTATFTGVHDHDQLLSDWSPPGLEHAASEMQSLRRDLARTRKDPAAIPAPLRLDLELADAFLDVRLAEMEGPHFERGNPALHTGEAIFGIVSLMLRAFAPAPARAEAVRARLAALPAFLEAAVETLGNHPLPAPWLRRAVAECDAGQRLLGNGLARWARDADAPKTIASKLEPLAAGARDALAGFAAWLRVRPPAEPSAAACGREHFDLVLARAHFEPRSTRELLAAVRQGLRESLARLHTDARAVSLGGWPEVQAELQRRHPAREGYLDAFGDIWSACRAAAEEHDLLTWPDYPIRYVPFPAWAREAAPDLYFLYYRSPAPFDPAGTVEYLTPPLDDADAKATLEATNQSVIKLNHVVHHGAIGHHLQNYYAYHNASRVGQIAAVDAASRIGMLLGGTMAEGWACYATDLMEEVGFLTPLEAVAQQHARVRQLARAVVDIELHTGAMTPDQAAGFFAREVGATEGAATKEITRISMFPGTGIMYWLGTRAIHQLRAEVARREGTRFLARRFHGRLLSHGSIPVPLIAQQMLAADR